MAGRPAEAWRSVEPVILRELDSAKLRVTVQTARHNPEEFFLHGAARLALSRVFRHQEIGW